MSSYRAHYFHLIWSTKYRLNHILPTFQLDLYNYISGIIANSGGRVFEIGGTANHIHILLECSNLDHFTSIIRNAKASSSSWIKQKDPNCSNFAWQEGYGSFSVSLSQIEATRNYIKNQEEHHKKFSFEEEYIKFLKTYQIDYNPKFVFGDT